MKWSEQVNETKSCAYSDFASVYDIFMDETPYEAWCEFIIQILKENRITSGLVLDLGCGTGKMTRLLRDRGYDMIGVDSSQEMLSVARNAESLVDFEDDDNVICNDTDVICDNECDYSSEDAYSGEEYITDGEMTDGDYDDILYLCQDMREFELYGTVAAVVCVCDSVNYLTSPEDVCTTFGLVNNYLDPGGIFIFDFNTTYKYEKVIGNRTIAESRDDCSFIWDNYYHSDSHINEYDLTLFIGDCEDEQGEILYRRTCETHYQRGYTLDEMTELVKRAGMELVKAVDAETYADVTLTSERIYVIAREITK